MNIDEWCDGDPGRRGYPHHDYGAGWVDEDRPGVDHRLVWASGTGELYALAGDQVNVLGLVESADQVDEALFAAGQRYPSLALNRVVDALHAQQLLVANPCVGRRRNTSDGPRGPFKAGGPAPPLGEGELVKRAL